ncbi:antitoxin VapB family protein [Saliphagus sp. LR7]|uniref:antitoxin VapB family protein n=1 Tax=Saliphagus sp. LR7 TaxID=2282654 RepID=UPI000DF73B07|nr:antitoxin VapB family protein [Saliphagus sp. LR7]
MGVADEQIRVSETVKRTIDRHRREGESYNDALERLLADESAGDFADGFGRWSADEVDRVREGRRSAKERRKRRMRERVDDTA